MHITFTRTQAKTSRPIYLLKKTEEWPKSLPAFARAWLKANHFTGKAGEVSLLPTAQGEIYGAACGLGEEKDAFALGDLSHCLPDGDWHFVSESQRLDLILLSVALGSYEFSSYKKPRFADKKLGFYVPPFVDLKELERLWQSTSLTRDLINMPANEMTPEKLAQKAKELAELYEADFSCCVGEELLKQNFPLIYAAGQASSVAPRLIDMRWGDAKNPTVTLVGKGVSFDTGGLDIKPPSSMLLMKKDMGGAANVLGLARMIMDAKLPVRLRVLIPAVENAISGNAFRPSDVFKSRKGLTVEIGNTDAEGRLILADALAYADEEAPDYLIDMATLTGAARVALGPDLGAFFTPDDESANVLQGLGREVFDPVWRLPLWAPYHKKLHSSVADMNNITKDGFAGSITAALFLQSFVEKAKLWMHFDIYGWTPSAKPGFPVGGEAQAIRALYAFLKNRL